MAQIVPRNLQEVFDNMSDNDNSDNESSEIDDSSLKEKKEKEEPLTNIHELLAEPIQCCSTYGECPICYDELNMINITVTRCGHIMHSSCIFISLETCANCPMCRTQLMRDEEDEEDDDQDEYEEGDDQGDQDEEDQEENDDQDNTPTLEQLFNKMLNMGYTPVDFMGQFLQRLAKNRSANKARYTDEFFENMDSHIDGLIDGTISLSSRDTRTYADVVKKTIIPVEAQAQAQAV